MGNSTSNFKEKITKVAIILAGFAAGTAASTIDKEAFMRTNGSESIRIEHNLPQSVNKHYSLDEVNEEIDTEKMLEIADLIIQENIEAFKELAKK